MASEVAASEPEKKDFWISYNKADRQWAEWIAWQLEEAGYSTILQAWDFRPGGNFVLDMDRAAREANRVIPVLSPDFFDSRFTQPEWAIFFSEDPTSENHRIVPALVRECEATGLLAPITRIKLLDLTDENEAIDVLLEGVRVGRAKPTVTPGFPGASNPERTGRQPHRFPGSMPPVWNIPFLRSRLFAGRQLDLLQLWGNFTSGEQTRVTQAIFGRGGMGKTQLALEYAYSYRSNYDVVWWIRAEDPIVLEGDLISLGKALQLPEAEHRDQAIVVLAVRRWLSEHTRWLLVFDNVENPQTLQQHLPLVNSGHVLITSQNPNWRGVALPFLLLVLPRDEAAKFLLDRTGSSDLVTATELANELGDLPLALDQAGAYIEQTQCGLPNYLQLFRTRSRELIHLGRTDSAYNHTVATTWNLSFARVIKDSTEAAQLLCLLAFYAPTEMRFLDIRQEDEDLPDGLSSALLDDIQFYQVISIIQRFSLLDIGNAGFTCHQLVQLVTRVQLDEEEEIAWALGAAHVMAFAFPIATPDALNWDTCERLLPHALASAQHTSRLGVSSEIVAALLTNIGGYLHLRGRLQQARSILEQDLTITEANVGPNDPRLAVRLNNLAALLSDMSEKETAREYLERAASILEHAGDEYLEERGKTLSNLGSVLHSLGRNDDALTYYKEAYEIHRDVLGEVHPTTAVDINNIGVLFRDKEDWEEALPYLTKSTEILASPPNVKDARYAMSACSLGMVLGKLERWQEAGEHLEEAVAVGEIVYREGHPDLVWFLNIYAQYLEAVGRLSEANTIVNRAMAIADLLPELRTSQVDALKRLKSRISPSVTRSRVLDARPR